MHLLLCGYQHSHSATPTLARMATRVEGITAEFSPITLSPYQAMNLNMPAILTKAGLKELSGSVNLDDGIVEKDRL